MIGLIWPENVCSRKLSDIITWWIPIQQIESDKILSEMKLFKTLFQMKS